MGDQMGRGKPVVDNRYRHERSAIRGLSDRQMDPHKQLDKVRFCANHNLVNESSHFDCHPEEDFDILFHLIECCCPAPANNMRVTDGQ
jgi:hypothetical protein